MNKKAAVIIVNWNGKRFLKDCLKSVLKQTYKNFVIYFVDNGSKDDSVKYVKNLFPNIKIIELDKNYGFAKGNNEGIKEAFKDKNFGYIVCLNNDTIVDKNWLKELVKTAEKNKRIGAVQSKIMLQDKETIHSVGGTLNYDFSSDSKGFGEKNGEYQEKEIELAIGCSVLIKTNVLKQIGLFDEKFFSYKEDDDLSIRVKKIGYKIFLGPYSIVYHYHSSTFGSKTPIKLYYNERNRIINLLTYGSFSQIFLSQFYTFIRYLKSKKSIDDNNSNSPEFVKSIILAHLHILILLPYIINKRIKNEKIFSS